MLKKCCKAFISCQPNPSLIFFSAKMSYPRTEACVNDYKTSYNWNIFCHAISFSKSLGKTASPTKTRAKTNQYWKGLKRSIY